MLSEAAELRLLAYVRRAPHAGVEYVWRPCARPMRGGTRVRYLAADFRRLVWADEELRCALLQDGGVYALAAILERHRCRPFHDLLDVVSAVHLERELLAGRALDGAAPRADAARPISGR